MNISNDLKGDVTVVSIEGSIDSKTVSDAQSKIIELVTGKTKVILDMTKVEFLSSAGLRMLLTLYRQVKSQNGNIILVGVSEEIKDVMENTGFSSYFVFTENIDSGIQELK
jgi:anti-sigma B factor antagonist